MEYIKRGIAVILVMTLVVTFAPAAFITEAFAAPGSADTRVADDATLDGWKEYFGTESNFSTKYSGHVWTDKSVVKDASLFSYAKELEDGSSKITIDANDENNFLVALSAMASSKSVKGETNKPTDTMIVLDLSSSMYNGSSMDLTTLSTMVSSVNSTIKKLQDLNVNNRVGVTIYFGGPDLLQATKNSYQLWLPLDRYTPVGSEFLVASKTSGTIKVGVKSGVKNSAGKEVSASRTVPNTAGTYTQQGILSALDQFMKADTYVPATASVNAGMPRVPVIVLMTDGEPTAATNKFSDINQDAIMGSNRVASRSPNETDFLTQLTGAYAKAMMDSHYKEEKPIFYTLSLGTSISYDVVDPSDTLGVSGYNPSSKISAYWSDLVKNGSVKINYQVCAGQWNTNMVTKSTTVSRVLVDGKSFPSNVDQRKYVDKAFAASNADSLTAAFNSLFTDISLQTHTYPTLVEDNENLDGYVSFVDKIGKYMNVTKIKGIIMGESWYSGEEFAKEYITDDKAFGSFANPTQLREELIHSIDARLGITDAATLINRAAESGQISYNVFTGEFSNYIGWYSNDKGEYLGFWNEGTTTAPSGAVSVNKSFLYLGETDESHGVSVSDMMYTSVRLSKNIATGEESIAFGVPAALIPTVEYNVELNQNGGVVSVSKGGATKPVRLVYEVALSDEINSLNLYDTSVVSADYIAANKNSDGSVNFYTNQYEADHSVGYGKVNTYSYFRPSRQNESYYYQEDSTVYSDKNGTVYKSASAPSGDFYRAITVYIKDGNSVSKETEYVKIDSTVLATADDRSDNSWFIPRGDVFLNVSNYLTEKKENRTGTLENANNPFVDIYRHSVNEQNHRFVVGDTLGNNGRVTVYPETGLKIEKAVTGNTAAVTEEFEFTVSSAEETDGEYSAIHTDANGTITGTTVKFSGGEAKVYLKDGESVIVTGLGASKKYTVTETEEVDFVLSEVKVNGNTAEKAPEVTLEENKIATVGFTNVPRETGILTVAKLLEYPDGTNPAIEDKTFTVKVKLEGIAVAANAVYTAKHTDNPNFSSVTLDQDKSFTATLKNGESIEVFDIPEGTIATVTETNVESIFTVSYIENNKDTSVPENTDGVIEIVKAPTIDTVTVVNKYNQAPVNVKIDLSGTKYLVDKNGQAAEWPDGAEFSFILQKYNEKDNAWTDVETVTMKKGDSNTIAFDELALSFDKVGTYGYQIVEKNHGLTIDGIIHDSTMHTFDVVVTDNDLDGKLEAAVHSSHNTGGNNTFVLNGDVWVNSSIDFTNVNNQQSTSVLIMIKKLLNNPSNSPLVSPEGFEFELYEMDSTFTNRGNVIQTTEKSDAAGESYVFLEYDYDVAGNYDYYYQLREKIPGNAVVGMEYAPEFYNFKVEVTAESTGAMSAVIVPVEEPGNNNSRKIMTDYVEANTGTHYNLATFTNKYEPEKVEVTLDVTKTLTGKNLGANDFSFTIEEIGGTYSETVGNSAPDADGKAAVGFTALTFDKVGTYKYTVRENVTNPLEGYTYDDTVFEVVITVTDGENGTDEFGNTVRKLVADVDVLTVADNAIVFENSYEPKPVDVEIEGTKTLTGKNIVAGQFSFILEEYDENGNVIANGKKLITSNIEDGSFAFEKLTYNTAGTHYYKVREEIPDEKLGIEYDINEYLIEIKVEYDANDGVYEVTKTVNGKVDDPIAFRNEYIAEPTATTINGFKSLEGRNIANEQFEFMLYESDANWGMGTQPILTVKNDADGNFEFPYDENSGTLCFSSAGEYYFIVDEVKPDPVPAGYTYDEKMVGVIVTVTDDLIGKLHAEVAYKDIVNTVDDQGNAVTEITDTASIIFNNLYEITGTADITIKGTKIAKGFDLQENLFIFLLNNEKKEGVKAATNDADGNFVINMTYYPSDVGNTYTYYLSERDDAKYGIVYDKTVYKIEVSVSDNGRGGIETAVSVNGNPYDPQNPTEETNIVFENSFYVEPPKDPEDPKKGGSDNEPIISTGGDINTTLLSALGAISVLGAAITLAAGKRKK